MVDPKVWQVVLLNTSTNTWHFVDHKLGLLTTGFGSREALLKNADIIRDTPVTRQLMTLRYRAEFPSLKPVIRKYVGRWVVTHYVPDIEDHENHIFNTWSAAINFVGTGYHFGLFDGK